MVILLVYYHILILSIFLDSWLRFDIMGSKSSADVTSTEASAGNTLSIMEGVFFCETIQNDRGANYIIKATRAYHS